MDEHLDRFLNFKSTSLQKTYTERNLDQSKNIYKYYLRYHILIRILNYVIITIIVIKDPIDQDIIRSSIFNFITLIITFIIYYKLDNYDYKKMIISIIILYLTIISFGSVNIIINKGSLLDDPKDMFSSFLYLYNYLLPIPLTFFRTHYQK